MQCFSCKRVGGGESGGKEGGTPGEQGRIRERGDGRRQTDRMMEPDRETGTEKGPENP